MAEDRQRRLTLLGGFVLVVDGRVQDLPHTAQRLLAYLSLHPGRGRSVVASALWPKATEQHALGSLRSALWRLRAAHLGLDGTASALLLPAELDVDVHALQRALHAPPHDMPTWLGEDGELLPGWNDEWVLLQRERLRQLRLHAGEAVAEALCDQRQFGPALEVALQVLACEPLRESAQRLVIQVHLAEGNHVEAVRQYETCCALLREELGVGPSPSLMALVRPTPAPRTPGVMVSSP